MPVIRRLGGLTFNGNPDAEGTRWGCEELVGWYDGPTMRQQTLSVTGQHGGVMSENFYLPRDMVLRGWAVPGAGVEPHEISEALSTAAETSSSAKTLYVDESVPKQCSVYRAGDIRSRLMEGSERVVQFEIPLTAPDPRKYSQTLNTASLTVLGGGVDQVDSTKFTNAGNFWSFPEEIVISGNGEWPIRVERRHLVDNSVMGTIVLTSNIGGSNEFRVLPQTREVFFGAPGSQVRAYELISNETTWWRIAANGATRVRLSRANAALGELTAQIKWRSSWI